MKKGWATILLKSLIDYLRYFFQGKNLLTFWQYTAYSGYFVSEIDSLIFELPINKTINNKQPAIE